LKSAIIGGILIGVTLLPFGLQPSMAASPGAGRAVWNRPADLEAIRSIENRMADTSNADGLGDLVSDQAVLVDAYVPAVSRGRASILDAYRRYRDALGGRKGRFTEISVISTPHFACSASQIRFDVPASGIPTTPVEYRKLDVFKKIGGRWQLIQQRISAAIDRQTGMVAAGPLPVRGPLEWNHGRFAGLAWSLLTVDRRKSVAELCGPEVSSPSRTLEGQTGQY